MVAFPAERGERGERGRELSGVCWLRSGSGKAEKRALSRAGASGVSGLRGLRGQGLLAVGDIKPSD